MRDLEIIVIVFIAVEIGYVVFFIFYIVGAVKIIDRIIDVFLFY